MMARERKEGNRKNRESKNISTVRKGKAKETRMPRKGKEKK